MKLVNVALALLAFSAAVQAESVHARELRQLTEQRDKALAAAAEPINRRYQAALDQLLRRATQANDLETALQIKGRLVGANVSAPAAAAGVVGTWTFRWEGEATAHEREIRGDGTISRGQGKAPGKWVIRDSLLKIEFPDGQTNEFRLPLRDGKLVGTGKHGGSDRERPMTGERK